MKQRKGENLTYLTLLVMFSAQRRRAYLPQAPERQQERPCKKRTIAF